MWLERTPLDLGVGSIGASRELFYGLARQTKHGGLVTIVESFDAKFSGFAVGGSTLEFNWLLLNPGQRSKVRGDSDWLRASTGG